MEDVSRTRAGLPALIFLMVLSFAAPSFAVDQDIIDAYPTAAPSPQQQVKEDEDLLAEIKKRFDMSAFLDVQLGYDNNVDLDSKRHKDGFQQSTANVDLTYRAMDRLNLKAGTDVFETIYFKYNRNNIVDVAPYAGFDLYITPDLISRNRFIFDAFVYPNEKESTYYGIALSTYLRHYFYHDVYQELGFEYLKRWYPERKTFNSAGRRCDKDRIDDRVRVKYTVGAYFDRAFLRVSNEYSGNDSNDDFQQYYDYQVYRLRPSVMFFFTDDIYTDVSLVYKYTRYKDRRTTEDPGQRESDHTYIFNSSLYYDITKNLALGVTYSYSENASNDPFQKYSESIISGGVYCSF